MSIELGKKLWLQELIKRKGFRQYEIAKLLGINESLFSKYVIGAREINEERKEKLAKILNVKKEDV